MNNQKNLWRYMIANIPLDINYEPGKEWQLFYSVKEQKRFMELSIIVLRIDYVGFRELKQK